MRHKHKRMGNRKTYIQNKYKSDVTISDTYILWGYLVLVAYTHSSSSSVSARSKSLPIPWRPQLQTGDQVLVNKWIAGPRLFNIFASMKGKRVDIYRVPGVGQIKRNDILVFNYPHPYSWERIEMHIMQYYIKRCLGLPGDSIRIEQGFYRNNHTKEPLGNVESQANLSRQKRIGCRTVSTVVSLLILHSIGMFMISVLCISPEKGINYQVNQTNYKRSMVSFSP